MKDVDLFKWVQEINYNKLIIHDKKIIFYLLKSFYQIFLEYWEYGLAWNTIKKAFGQPIKLD